LHSTSPSSRPFPSAVIAALAAPSSLSPLSPRHRLARSLLIDLLWPCHQLLQRHTEFGCLLRIIRPHKTGLPCPQVGASSRVCAAVRMRTPPPRRPRCPHLAVACRCSRSRHVACRNKGHRWAAAMTLSQDTHFDTSPESGHVADGWHVRIKTRTARSIRPPAELSRTARVSSPARCGRSSARMPGIGASSMSR
jgi:hypothetical protein